MKRTFSDIIFSGNRIGAQVTHFDLTYVFAFFIFYVFSLKACRHAGVRKMRHIQSNCQFVNVRCIEQREMDVLCASSNSNSSRHMQAMQVYEGSSINWGKPADFVRDCHGVKGLLYQGSLGTLSVDTRQRWARPIASDLTASQAI